MAAIAKRVIFRANQFRDGAKPEAWKADHDEAMQVLDLEYMLADGIELWELFVKLLDAWTEDVEENRTPFDPFVEKCFDEAQRTWLQTALKLERLARGFEKKGYKIERVEAFRGRLNNAAFLLADVEELHRKIPAIEQARKKAIANARTRRESSKKP